MFEAWQSAGERARGRAEERAEGNEETQQADTQGGLPEEVRTRQSWNEMGHHLEDSKIPTDVVTDRPVQMTAPHP